MICPKCGMIYEYGNICFHVDRATYETARQIAYKYLSKERFGDAEKSEIAELHEDIYQNLEKQYLLGLEHGRTLDKLMENE